LFCRRGEAFVLTSSFIERDYRNVETVLTAESFLSELLCGGCILVRLSMHTQVKAGPNGIDDYQDAWKRYKRLRALWLVISLMELGPTEVIFAGILPAVEPATRDFVQIFLSFSLLFLIDTKLRRWKCPRCGQSFFSGAKPTRPLRWLFLPQKCRFCGLPKYALHP
jgi:hypothetical protein